MLKAIDSVLVQNFKDFEMLIVDNSSNVGVGSLIKGYDNDKIKYIKTGGLSMPDNWEFAYSKASGSYLITLTDRMYFSDAYVLSCIYKVATSSKNPYIITWPWGTEDKPPRVISIKKRIKKYVKLSSRDLMQGFFDGGRARHAFNAKGPRGLNAALPRICYEQTLNKFASLTDCLSPDYVMSFRLLQEYSELLHINSPLIISGGGQVSNGFRCKNDKAQFLSYVESCGMVEEATFHYTLIKLGTVFNSIYNDFFSQANKFGWAYTWNDIDLVNYFLLIYEEISAYDNIQIRNECIAEWGRSLDDQDEVVRLEVLQRLSIMHVAKRKRPFFLRLFGSNSYAW